MPEQPASSARPHEAPTGQPARPVAGNARLAAARHRLEAMPLRWFIFGLTAATLVLSVWFYSPRFENWQGGYPYSWETYRGAGFLVQCRDLFSADVEPALRWRLLPPALCYFVGLRNQAALLLPWAGVVALTASAAWLLLQRGVARATVVPATLLLGSTATLVISLGWLGVNDAWVWCGLVTVALSDRSRTRGWWAVFGPWIDERFVIGLPVALLLNAKLSADPGTWRECLHRYRTTAIGPALYLAIRAGAVALDDADHTVTFFAWTSFKSAEWLPHALHGWWQGLRAAWVLVALSLFWPARNRLPGLNGLLVLTAAATVAAMMVLAADLSRSAPIMAPAALAGVVFLERRNRLLAIRVLLGVLVLNWILPAATVVGPYTLWLENFLTHNF